MDITHASETLAARGATLIEMSQCNIYLPMMAMLSINGRGEMRSIKRMLTALPDNTDARVT
jgi:hypothetical protein